MPETPIVTEESHARWSERHLVIDRVKLLIYAETEIPYEVRKRLFGKLNDLACERSLTGLRKYEHTED